MLKPSVEWAGGSIDAGTSNVKSKNMNGIQISIKCLIEFDHVTL